MAEGALIASAAELAREDPRLTSEQAARIARQLAEPPVRGRRRPPPRPVYPAQGADVGSVLRRVLDQIVKAMPSAVGARLRVSAPDGEIAEHVGRADGRPAVEVPFHIESRLEGVLALHIAEGTSGDLSDDDRKVLEAVGSFTGATVAAARSVGASLQDMLTAQVAASPFASLFSTILGPSLDHQLRRAETVDRVRRTIADDQLRTVFQPVVDLDDGEVVGYEALTRFPPDPPIAVGDWFTAAADAGCGTDLELAAARRAITYLPRIDGGCFLAVNVSPRTATTTELADVIRASDPRRVVLEITEHAPVDDYAALGRALDELRKLGVRLAIDDAGAGFASLRHVLRLTPDLIKLDLSLVHRIDADPLRRALATSLITFASEAGATIVAEGIETRFECDTLVALGVRFGQGFHLGRPEPLA